MKLDERLKEKFLKQKSKNIFKYIYYFFQKLKKDKYIKKSYSGGAIDLIVDYHFRDKKKGIYIDVGAYHPFKSSNTYKLFSRGWCGINIDLDYQTIDIFNHFRSNDENICAAISDIAAEKKLFFHHNRSTINTLEAKLGHRAKEIKRLKTTTLNNILENSKFKNSELDFLSIDVEGHEFNVIKGLDLEKYPIKIIVIEYQDPKMKKVEFYNQDIERTTQSDIYKYMKSKNYVLINWLHSDLVFINKKLQD
ncbi:FkbM family methyltransferase [Candidatus Pelagibacter sp.]|nr:FkbM family methyltransferase [Candidatus Pelagibacter sp.]